MNAEIVALLERHFGLHVEALHRLGGEIDDNFAADTAGGRRVVVKVGPADTDLARVRWQHELLGRLRTDSDAPPVPQVLLAEDGSDVVALPDARPVRVQSWLPGRTLAQLDRHSPRLLREWGRAAAQLVLALPADAPEPVAATTHHWDVLRAGEAVAAGLPAVRDPGRIHDVDRIIRRYDAVVPGLVAELPRQVVHQDLNDFNVLAQADAENHHHVSGVLDFADMLHTARVTELAVAVAYAMLRKADPLVSAAHVVHGFCELVGLSDAELAVVHPLAAARLCVNATTWTARAEDNPAYAEARMRHTWPTIAYLAGLPASVARASLDSTGRSVRLRPVPEPVRRRTRTGAPTTLWLGIEPDGPPRTPRAATVESNDGTRVVLRHDTDDGHNAPCWSRWAPVTGAAPAGSVLAAGDTVGSAEAGMRVSVFTDAEAAELAPELIAWPNAAAWHAVSLDPAIFLGGNADAPRADPVTARATHFASSQRFYYDDPPRLVASRDVWLHDDRGLAYLDAINNVSHVGHANEAVVEAMCGQARRLNTNSRFVYDGIADYAARLAALLPDPLEVVFLVCSGSEANDLALRIARQVTGREDVLVIDGAYHGNTSAVTAVSPNRYKGPGGPGRPATTHEVVQPNRYRGPYGYDDPDAGARYAADVAAVANRLVDAGRPPAAFLAESLLGTAGAVIHPPGYLAAAFAAVRDTGGLCVSDEVQVGFGRLGDCFWGFEAQQVVPDIVTMGKPIGNGHPMAAVVTTRAIADAFDTGMKYFNTFGGNPVSCAVGMAVLDEIESRDLPAAARDTGDHLRRRLQDVASRHPLIGDVRGHGLYLGVELVRDRTTKEPAGAAARYVSERMKDEGVIVYPTGAHDNVLKIKPPMTFGREHADLFSEVLDGVLSDDW